jgi:hypothetical protein
MPASMPGCLNRYQPACLNYGIYASKISRKQYQLFYFPDSLFSSKNGWVEKHRSIFHNLQGKTQSHNNPEAEEVWKQHSTYKSQYFYFLHKLTGMGFYTTACIIKISKIK